MWDSGKYLLLQINDSLFPIGGYAHSYGMETYIAKGIITGKAEAKSYIESSLELNLLNSELLGIKLAYNYSSFNNLPKILELEDIMKASKAAEEIRLASLRLGSRFLKAVDAMNLKNQNSVFERYRLEKEHHYAIAYGVLCQSVQISQYDACAHFLYAQASAMVTNLVKSVPLKQSNGQEILSSLYPVFHRLLEKLEDLGEEEFCRSTPGFEIRCMQHECLYTRLYMS